MRNIISFMHISLDGFVAGLNGEMNWITINDEIFQHVEKRIAGTDTALYGRRTYEMMENYWPTAADRPGATRHDLEHAKWYKGARKIVLSKTMRDAGLHNATIISEDLATQIRAIKQEEGPEILLFGSPRATHALIEQNLIDGFWLFVNPVILGQGIPLFKNIKNQTKLRRLNTKAFDCGVTELDYLVEK